MTCTVGTRLASLAYEFVKVAALNIVLCFVIGVALGGIVLAGNNEVVIRPITMVSMIISGIILGGITGALVVRGVTKGVADAVAAGEVNAEKATQSRGAHLRWMPKNTVGLAVLFSGGAIVVSVAVLVVAMLVIEALLSVQSINYYWFLVIVSAWSFAIGKAATWLLQVRCLQPDYLETLAHRI